MLEHAAASDEDSVMRRSTGGSCAGSRTARLVRFRQFPRNAPPLRPESGCLFISVGVHDGDSLREAARGAKSSERPGDSHAIETYLGHIERNRIGALKHGSLRGNGKSLDLACCIQAA
jgi:hypothetical protein